MTPSDDLFRLIQSLSKAEKGHFRKYASRHAIGGKNDYLRLFEAIDGMEHYDEGQLRKLLAGGTLAARLPAVKHYLYRIILKSLRAYQEESGIERTLLSEIANVTILYQRGLIDQATRGIERVKKTARAELRVMELLRAVQLERLLLSERAYHEDVSALVSANIDEEERLLRELLNVVRYERTSKKIVRAVQRLGGTRSEQERRELDELMDDPFLQDEANALTPRATFLHHHIRSTHAYAVGNYEGCYASMRRIVELFREEPALWKHTPARYLTIVNNLVAICQFVGRYREAWEWIQTLRAMPAPNENLAIDKFTTVRGMELTLLLKIGAFERALEAATEIEEEYRHFEAGLSRSYRYLFCYHIAWTAVGVGRYEMALAWLAPILNDTEADIRHDLACFARILNLIVHYELGNRELLPYAVRSTYRALCKRNRLNGVESVLLRSIRALARAERKREIMAIFARMKTELEALADDPSEQHAFAYFHFIPWLRAKMTGRLLAEMFDDPMRALLPEEPEHDSGA
jgi:hypothetical protein